jgi:hypothetical protein
VGIGGSGDMTIFEISATVAIVTMTLTMFSLIGKFLWNLISLKMTAKYKDYLPREQIEEMMSKVIKEQSVITMEMLTNFCNRMQQCCPKVAESKDFGKNLSNISLSLNKAMEEQKKLREETLPEKYTPIAYFKETVERIENSVDKAVIDFKGITSGIFNRIDDLSIEFDTKIGSINKRIDDAMHMFSTRDR